jgi:hypothetical protein
VIGDLRDGSEEQVQQQSTAAHAHLSASPSFFSARRVAAEETWL